MHLSYSDLWSQIYKITENRFYCEICNLVFKKAEDHIMETTHQDLKNSNTFAKQRTSNVDKLLSNEKLAVSTWQGLNNDMCLLCDEPFGVVIRHIKSFDHLVNLLQSETISENGNCYRKQSANRFYCFKCFKVYDKDDLDAHWTECHQNSQKISEEKTNEENMKKALMKSQTKSTETNVLKRTRNKYFNFEMENKAICLRCKEEVDLNYEAIDGHIKIHEKLQNIDLERPLIDKGKRRAELADYGRNNFITLNQGGSKSYCTLCCVYMSPHIKNAKDHVGGSLHRGHLELRGLIQKQKHDIFPVQLIPHRYFVKVLQGPQIINGVSVVCINNDICVTLLSYMLISANYNFNDDILKCYGCNILINSSDFKIHIKSEEHKANVWKCKVLLISVKCVDEYIREVRPNLYHCGYCNCIFPFWENLMKHLKSLLHIEMRISKPKFTGGIMMRQKY